jgi:N-acetylmuramic acid 6-phosphate (MurNAc-6-P) etherase
MIPPVRFIEQSDGDVRIAVLLGFGLGPTEAARALGRHEGNLRKAIDEIVRDQV